MPRILVLEDDQPLGRTVCEALAHEGHEPSLATSLPAALEALDRAPVDLVITNVGRMQGDRLDLQRIQVLRERAPTAKVIVFTGHAQARQLKLDELGLAAVVLKPADLGQLMAAVTRALDDGAGAPPQESMERLAPRAR